MRCLRDNYLTYSRAGVGCHAHVVHGGPHGIGTDTTSISCTPSPRMCARACCACVCVCVRVRVQCVGCVTHVGDVRGQVQWDEPHPAHQVCCSLQWRYANRSHTMATMATIYELKRIVTCQHRCLGCLFSVHKCGHHCNAAKADSLEILNVCTVCGTLQVVLWTSL